MQSDMAKQQHDTDETVFCCLCVLHPCSVLPKF